MARVRFLGLILIFITLLVLITITPGQKEKKGERKYESEIITIKGGFGYQISNGKQIFIRQEFIPAVQGKIPFLTKKDAKIIADLVLEKLSNGESPIINFQEVLDLDIQQK